MAKTVHYWTLVEPIWLPLNRSWDVGPKSFVRRFRSVRPEAGHLYAAHWCQSEVCNGGFYQFFWNTTGLLAPEAVDGFRVTGAIEWADILAEAMKHFGKPYPRDRGDRAFYLPIPQRGPNKKWDPFYKFNQRFYDWVDSWEDTANAFAQRVIAKGGS